MSTYENPEVDHSVNVSEGSALREFISLSAWLVFGFVLLVVVVFFGVRWLAPLMPFSWEQRMADPLVKHLSRNNETHALEHQRAIWLQALADRLRPKMDWPVDMPIHVHWVNSDVPNAFAILGGHIFIHQGMLDRVTSENAVAMVLAHEMAHIKHRDPLVALGSGLTVSLALHTLLGSTGLLSEKGGVIGAAAVKLTRLGFSRRNERAADTAALAALQAYYGHLSDAEAFFSSMLCEEFAQRIALPQFLQTHPDIAARVKTIRMQAASIPVSKTAPVPLPAFMHDLPTSSICIAEAQ